MRRFEERIEERLQAMQARCEKLNRDVQKVEREVGRLLGQKTRAAGLFDVEVKLDQNGFAKLIWKKIAQRTDWATLSAGCYLLRSNVTELPRATRRHTDWREGEPWQAYMQLTEA